MNGLFPTVFIDTESEAGAYEELLPHLVNCRVSNFQSIKNIGGEQSDMDRLASPVLRPFHDSNTSASEE